MNFKDIPKNITGISYQKNKNGRCRAFIVNYKNKKADVYIRKHFSLNKYGGAKKTFQTALSYRQYLEEKFGTPSNRPINNRKQENYCIKKGDYFVLQIVDEKQGHEISVKIDIEHLKEVKKHHWSYDHSSQKTTYISAYINQEKTRLSKFLYPKQKNKVINHKNRDRFDFRSKNITFDNNTQYQKAIRFKASETAPPGVSFVKDSKPAYDYTYWKAGFQRGDHNKCKWYSIQKYGYEEAKELAIEKRNEWEEEYQKELENDS